MRNIIADFTKAEKERLQYECDFSNDEQELFDLRGKGLSLEECAERMYVSVKTAGRINKRINSKIQKVLRTL